MRRCGSELTVLADFLIPFYVKHKRGLEEIDKLTQENEKQCLQILIRNRMTNCKKMRDRYRAAIYYYYLYIKLFLSFGLDFIQTQRPVTATTISK